MPRRLRRACALLAGALLSVAAWACAPALDAALLSVGEVDAVARSGRRLRIAGAGFPPGTGGSLYFSGAVHAPAAEPRSVRAELPLHAESERLAFGPEGRVVTAALGPGTFTGFLEVRFPAAEGGVVRGRRQVELRLDEAAGWRAERAGHEAAAALGLTVDAAAVAGLDVLAVLPGSAAHAAGLVAGDRLLHFGRVAVASPADLRWVPGSRRVQLELMRGPRRVTTELRRPAAAPVTGPKGALLALLALLALALVLLGPLGPRLEAAREAALARLRATPRRRVGRQLLAMLAGAAMGGLVTGPMVPALVAFDALARGAGALQRRAPLASSLAGAPSWGAWFLLAALADGGANLALRSPVVALAMTLALLGAGPAASPGAAAKSLDARRAVAVSATLALGTGPGAPAGGLGLALA
ncbi:MAG: hypothetical protein AAF447_27305, partial [Myxococcota bacterium]